MSFISVIIIVIVIVGLIVFAFIRKNKKLLLTEDGDDIETEDGDDIILE